MKTKINNETDGKCGYLALYNGKQAEVWADTMLAAKTLAVAYFKPPKSRTHLVSVHLCESNGGPVVHTPTE